MEIRLQANPTATPGVTQALGYIKGLAADPVWQAGGELPEVRTLARLSGFPLFTIWKALGLAAKANLVIVHLGRRPRLRKSAFTLPPATERTGLVKWERLRMEIERDLLEGIYEAGGASPLLKDMQGRYQVCYSTLRKALHDLVRSGRWPPAHAGCRSRGSRPPGGR